jgi:hypothetical protein
LIGGEILAEISAAAFVAVGEDDEEDVSSLRAES